MDQLEEIKQHMCDILIIILKTMLAHFPGKIIVRIKIDMYLMYLNQQGIHFGFKFQTSNVLLCMNYNL